MYKVFSDFIVVFLLFWNDVVWRHTMFSSLFFYSTVYHGSSSRFWFCWMFCVIFDKHQCCNVFTAMNYWQHSIMETNKLTCCLRLINNLTYLKCHVLPRQCIMQHFSVFSFKSIKLWTFMKTRMKRLAFLHCQCPYIFFI